LPFDFVVFFEPPFFDDFLPPFFIAMALVPPFSGTEFTDPKILSQRFFSIAFSFFTMAPTPPVRRFQLPRQLVARASSPWSGG
jgi:hypothetical protein